jgi:hypothetical protein
MGTTGIFVGMVVQTEDPSGATRLDNVGTVATQKSQKRRDNYLPSPAKNKP